MADIVERLGLGLSRPPRPGRGPAGRSPLHTLVVRAVARLRKLLEWFQPHWGAMERMLVLKGPAWVEERGEARHYGLMHDLVAAEAGRLSAAGHRVRERAVADQAERALILRRRLTEREARGASEGCEHLPSLARRASLLPANPAPARLEGRSTSQDDAGQGGQDDGHDAEDPDGSAARRAPGSGPSRSCRVAA